MRFPIRAIVAGIIIGALFFFFPFFIRLIFIFLLIGLAIRLFIGYRWFGRRHYHWGYGPYRRWPYEDYYEDEDDAIPIDGKRFHSSIGKKGPITYFNVQ